jgi:transposase-like protein
MVRQMTELRELGVPVARIARKFGVNDETVRRHTSGEDQAKILEGQQRRYAKYRADPEIMERRRNAARENAKRKKAQRQAERSGL